MKSYIVVGLGRFGTEVARQLCALGGEVLAVDSNEELVNQISNDVTHAVVADARDKSVLRALLATMNLKELGVPKIVCKAHDETHRQVLLKLGADEVVIPEKENAARLARSLSSPNVLEYIELSEEYGIIEVPAPKRWLDKTLKELNVRAKLGVNIIAVERGSKIDVSPAADYRIMEGDIMVVLGDADALSTVQKL